VNHVHTWTSRAQNWAAPLQTQLLFAALACWNGVRMEVKTLIVSRVL